MDMSPQLFDTAPYTVQRPATHSEALTPAVDTRTPQQRKLQANRDRIIAASPGSADRYRDIITGDEHAQPVAAPVTSYGIPYRSAASTFSHLTPFDTAAFRRHGRYAEMPIVGTGEPRDDELFNTPHGPRLGAGQSDVAISRVDELAKNPDLGKDPRFPNDLPLVADVRFPRRGSSVYAPVIHNGTHRVMAAVQRGEMFTPVQYVDRHHLPDAIYDAQNSRDTFGGVRMVANQIAYDRMSSGDATVGKGSMSDGHWDFR